ncbi:hypothetical protein JZ751_026493 [Albula glossodonta]|uniref:Coenzyme Q-binding protein COQ10 START domain-containing protein n=1 Tax=Albula glossodonta TaxID=121402 RepID=A0A8T2PDL9_9TELE|nr:hypothetical protein JZ751_026493 [Albula glossodonta]
MTSKKATLLVRALIEITELNSFKLVKGNSSKTNIRHMSSCGILTSRNASVLSSSAFATPVCTPSCSFISLAAPLTTHRIEYSESRNISVDKYHQFVPWCKKSRVLKGRNGVMKAQLEIGFPPIVERYTSDVTVVPNHQAVCTDGSLFSHLETVWRFGSGEQNADSCNVEFYVSFEFKSLLHTQLASMFFDEVIKQMVNAFEKRASTLYGPHVAVQEKQLTRSAALTRKWYSPCGSKPERTRYEVLLQRPVSSLQSSAFPGPTLFTSTT